MNKYFIYSEAGLDLIPGTTARAEDINSRMRKVVKGFEKLPPPLLDQKGFATPLSIPDPTEESHAVTVGFLIRNNTTYAIDSGIADAYSIQTLFPSVVYTEGMKLHFIAKETNTGASTIEIGSLGEKNLLTFNGEPLSPGDIEAGSLVTCIFHENSFYMTAPLEGYYNAFYLNYKDRFEQIKSDTEVLKEAAGMSAEKAATSAKNAAESEQNAANSARAAADSAGAAKVSEDNAAESAESAANSAESIPSFMADIDARFKALKVNFYVPLPPEEKPQPGEAGFTLPLSGIKDGEGVDIALLGRFIWVADATDPVDFETCLLCQDQEESEPGRWLLVEPSWTSIIAEAMRIIDDMEVEK